MWTNKGRRSGYTDRKTIIPKCALFGANYGTKMRFFFYFGFVIKNKSTLKYEDTANNVQHLLNKLSWSVCGGLGSEMAQAASHFLWDDLCALARIP